jgi:hypothetical protein
MEMSYDLSDASREVAAPLHINLDGPFLAYRSVSLDDALLLQVSRYP